MIWPLLPPPSLSRRWTALVIAATLLANLGSLVVGGGTAPTGYAALGMGGATRSQVPASGSLLPPGRPGIEETTVIVPSEAPTAVGSGWTDKPVYSREALCAVTITSDARSAADETVSEHVSCTLTMTDAAAGGELTADITIVFAPAASSGAPWAGAFSLVNAGGRWTGDGSGAAVRGGDGTGTPIPFGEIRFRGSGGHAGLLYTLLIAGDAGPASFSGWITGPSPLEPSSRLARFVG